jgi:hypothetical protein
LLLPSSALFQPVPTDKLIIGAGSQINKVYLQNQTRNLGETVLKERMDF